MAEHGISAHRQDTVYDVDLERLADMYAGAALNAAGDVPAQLTLLEGLESLVGDVLGAHPELEGLFRSEFISADEKRDMLDRLFAGKAPEGLLNLLKVMARHGRLGIVRAVARSARKLLDQRTNRVRVKMETALPLDPALQDELLGSLRQMLGAEPIVETSVNPELLAGFVVRVGDRIYDASARTNIERARRGMIVHAVEAIQHHSHTIFEQSEP
ncbi:MAG: ATP synthase F1 subunit delta [Planctomycetota bacterium]